MFPSRFALASDYGALTNDSVSTTITATITNGQIYNPSSPLLATATVAVGTSNALVRARGNTSRYAGWHVGTFLYSQLQYDIPSLGTAPADGMLMCSLYRVNATTMRLDLHAEGFSGAPDYRITQTQTITFVFSTFLSPFV